MTLDTKVAMGAKFGTALLVIGSFFMRQGVRLLTRTVAWAVVLLLLFARGVLGASENRKLTASSDSGVNDQFGWSVAIDGDTVVIGACYDDDGGNETGSAYVFVRSAGFWSQQAKLTASDAEAGDRLGKAVALSGDTAVIGASTEDEGGYAAGAVYVFTRTAGVWSEQAKLLASDAAAGDGFGDSVAVDGDTAVIGARLDDDDGNRSGSAYVFVQSAGVWSEQEKLTAADAQTEDAFGNSVAISGDTTLIGADQPYGGTGAAYVFTRTAGIWTQQAKLLASDAAAEDKFGFAVAVSGDTALIGATQEYKPGFNTGAAYVFVRGAGVWSQQAKIPEPWGVAGDRFGHAVALYGDTALIGAPTRDSGSGSDVGLVFPFLRRGTSWVQLSILMASDRAAFDQFGFSIAMDGDTAVVGARLDDHIAVDAGSAYVYIGPPVPVELQHFFVE